MLDQAPNFAEAWHKRSMAFYAQKKFREAVEDCVKAMGPWGGMEDRSFDARREALDIRPLHYWPCPQLARLESHALMAAEAGCLICWELWLVAGASLAWAAVRFPAPSGRRGWL